MLLEDLQGLLPPDRVGQAVHVLPIPELVRPDEELHALDQPVVVFTMSQCAV